MELKLQRASLGMTHIEKRLERQRMLSAIKRAAKRFNSRWAGLIIPVGPA